MGERGSTSPEKKGSNKGKKTYEFNTDDSKNEGEGGIVCTFGRREFNIITGLWGPKEDYIQLVGNSRLLEKFFKDKECIYVSDLEDIFLEYEGDDDDIVKLALVYFIEISLLGNDRRTKVDIGFFKIADDWNTFNNYDWGRIVFGRTLSALKRALDKQYAKGKKKSTQTKKYTINGFPHALQVWAYESISTIIGCGVDKVNDHVIPQMLRWVCQQSPKSQTISQVFDSPMLIIKAVIEMTLEEEQLKIASDELFENLRSSTIVQSKNGGSKRGREVVNDEDDFKKSKKQKSKTKMKKAIRNLQDRVAVVEGQLTSIKSNIDELKGMMSTILKHIGLQRKGDEGDRKVSEGLVDHTLESKKVDNAKTEDVDTGGTPNWLRMPKEDEHIELKKKGDEDVHTVGTPPWLRFNIELEKPIDVLEKKVDIDVTEVEPFPTQRTHVRPAHRKRASVYLSISFTTLPKRSVTSITTTSQSEPIIYDPMHKILDVHLDRLRAWITDKCTDDEYLDALFLFIHLKIKAVRIPSSQNFTTADTIFMRILVVKWPLYKECIKENRPFDWEEEYRLVDHVVGSKEDFQDPWASVDYIYSPFNVHTNHWVLLCLDLVSCQVKVWDSFLSLTTAEEMTNILLPIRELVPKLLDSTGFFDRRGRSSTYEEPWPVVIVDSIPLQRNNSDCGVLTIKYFEYIAAGVGLDILCQENMSYFRKQLAFQLWTNTPMY
ncbi:Ulp1-like peptidase [Cucumis melo var. makuwa]|uniref:Ulp1-like peptidase n=1 Tax=Cucumis melo var. makuwa TaxID=1194695 RepID=A0A5A7UFV4_CUCMM|nr:Ulp1-like peptidase [Cucumis melo var. makuwa]TYK03314.1 Ulp1-like peptidase [Cucumis melo var. makuwa]